MKRRDLILLLFLVLCLANLLFEFLRFKTGIFATKPLLMSTLALWFYLENRAAFTKFHQFLWLGFIFSIFGDSFLMFVENEPPRPHFFIYGLGSFLMTHICYIIAFWYYPAARKGLIQRQFLWMVPFILLFFVNIYLLWTGIPAAMKTPVVIYSLTIILMGIGALNLKYKAPDIVFYTVFTGAVLFIISDTIIGLNKFKSDDIQIPYVRLWIMGFYLMGQFFLAKGASLFRRSNLSVWK